MSSPTGGLRALGKRLPIRRPRSTKAPATGVLDAAFHTSDQSAQARQFRFRRNRVLLLLTTAAAAILGAFESAYDVPWLSIGIIVCSATGWLLVRYERKANNGTMWVEKRATAERLRSLRHLSTLTQVDHQDAAALIKSAKGT